MQRGNRRRQTHLQKKAHNEVGIGGQDNLEEKDYRAVKQM